MMTHHICVQTNDYEASKRFYMQILGFSLVSETENFHMRAYNSWLRGPDGLMIELQTPKGKALFSPMDKEA